MNVFDGVEKSVHITEKYKLVSREFKREDTVVNVGGALIGGGHLGVMAGPCADICMSNPDAIMNHLEELKRILDEVISSIEQRDRAKIHDYFLAAKQRRDNILDKTQNLFEI